MGKTTSKLVQNHGGDLARISVAIGASYYLIRMFHPMFLERRRTQQLEQLFKQRLVHSLQQRQSSGREDAELGEEDFDYVNQLSFDQYEANLLSTFTFSQEMSVTFDDIGGLDGIKEDLFEAVILPLKRPELFRAREGRLTTIPRGILFHGPPGTGKTLMAKAVAGSSGYNFLNIKVSDLMSMWVGESQKNTTAVFSLATKLAPCIIFLDEIDAVLGTRSGGGDRHPTFKQVQSLFLSCWDGLSTDESKSVVVMAATNRPEDLDPAFLRRLGRPFEFPSPDTTARHSILSVLLRAEPTDADVNLMRVAEVTQGYSGSDLKELCRVACLRPITEFVAQERHGEPVSTTPRSVCMADLQYAVQRVKPSHHLAYRR